MIQNGFQPDIQFLETGLTESDAIRSEIRLIQHFGRRDLQFGPLLNITDGGEGTIGYTHTEETKRKMSISKIGNNNAYTGVRNDIPNSKRSKIQYLHKGEMVKEYPSLAEVKRDGFRIGYILKILKGLRPAPLGYEWKYI
jgi:hypothetical protein